jgi:AAA-like domain
MSMPGADLRYVAGGTVQADQGVYVERATDAALLRLCREGAFAYVLTSRQMGKSSLMIRTAEQLIEEGISPVIIDLTELGGGTTANQWYRGILEKVAEQLQLSSKVARWWDSNEQQSVAQRFNGYLTSVVLREIPHRIVVFVDEIDTTLRLDFTDDFFASIRYLYNARATNKDLGRLSFVLLGVASPGDLIKDPERTPFNIGQRVDLDDFTEDEAVRDLNMDRSLVHSVFGYTNGHPYLTLRVFKSISEKPLDCGVETRMASLFFGEQAGKDSNLQFVRDMLTNRALDREAVLLRYRDIWRGKPVPDREADPVCAWLRLSGIVSRQNHLLRVRNVIYQTVFDDAWIRKNRNVNWARAATRVAGVAVGLLILVAAILAPFAYLQRNQAIAARTIAEHNASVAKSATLLVNHRLAIAQNTISLKRAIFFGDAQKFETAVRSHLDSRIIFRATRQEHPYKSRAGLPTYTFRMFPNEDSIPGGFKNLALVTYKMDNPTFPNSLITAGPDRHFAGSYDGVGCLTLVTVLLEFIDPDRMPSVCQFDQCALIDAELRKKSP